MGHFGREVGVERTRRASSTSHNIHPALHPTLFLNASVMKLLGILIAMSAVVRGDHHRIPFRSSPVQIGHYVQGRKGQRSN